MDLVRFLADEFDDVDLRRPASVDGQQPDRRPHALGVRKLRPDLPLAVLLLELAFGRDVGAGELPVADAAPVRGDVHPLSIHHDGVGGVVLQFAVVAPGAVGHEPPIRVGSESLETGVPDGDHRGEITTGVGAIHDHVVDPDRLAGGRGEADLDVPRAASDVEGDRERADAGGSPLIHLAPAGVPLVGVDRASTAVELDDFHHERIPGAARAVGDPRPAFEGQGVAGLPSGDLPRGGRGTAVTELERGGAGPVESIRRLGGAGHRPPGECRVRRGERGVGQEVGRLAADGEPGLLEEDRAGLGGRLDEAEDEPGRDGAFRGLDLRLGVHPLVHGDVALARIEGTSLDVGERTAVGGETLDLGDREVPGARDRIVRRGHRLDLEPNRCSGADLVELHHLLHDRTGVGLAEGAPRLEGPFVAFEIHGECVVVDRPTDCAAVRRLEGAGAGEQVERGGFTGRGDLVDQQLKRALLAGGDEHQREIRGGRGRRDPGLERRGLPLAFTGLADRGGDRRFADLRALHVLELQFEDERGVRGRTAHDPPDGVRRDDVVRLDPAAERGEGAGVGGFGQAAFGLDEQAPALSSGRLAAGAAEAGPVRQCVVAILEVILEDQRPVVAVGRRGGDRSGGGEGE